MPSLSGLHCVGAHVHPTVDLGWVNPAQSTACRCLLGVTQLTVSSWGSPLVVGLGNSAATVEQAQQHPSTLHRRWDLT